MSLPEPSILITGANGFVGARLCRTFLDKGVRVIAGVRRTADIRQLEGLDIEYRYGDITQPETLPSMVSDVDYIIHNAGVVKAKKPETFFDVNEKGTIALFDAIVRHSAKIKKVVYISSQAAAGPSIVGRPRTETDTPAPLSTYGRSKLAGERAALSYADRIPVVAVRPPGIYGPGDREILSFFATVNNHLKPYIGNTDRRLQLVHVDDLCRGIYLAVTASTASGEAYFIAEQQSYSMKELVALLGEACGKGGVPLIVPAPLFRLIARVSETALKIVGVTPMLTVEKATELLSEWEISVEKARRDLGFESLIPFAKGAKETYEWYRKEGWL